MPSRHVNVALIGYGYAGKTFHAPLIVSVPGLRLAAVVSSAPDRVQRDLPNVPVVATPEEAFAGAEIDLVVVATPNLTHFDLARRALAAGKHVVVDKPFTNTLAEARELAELSHKSGRMLSVFHNRRWDGDFLTARQIIASGKLGDVVQFESHYDRYRPELKHRWREEAGPGSGIWFDLGSHLLDQALQVFGMPASVFGDLAMLRDGAQTVDYFHVLLRYPRTRVILHGTNLAAAHSRRFEVHGTLASFLKEGTDPQEELLKAGIRPGDDRWKHDSISGLLVLGDGSSNTCETLPGNYPAYYAGVRDAILEGSPNPVPLEDAVRVIELLEAAVRSAESGRELKWGTD